MIQVQGVLFSRNVANGLKIFDSARHAVQSHDQETLLKELLRTAMALKGMVRSVPIEPVRPASLGSLGLPSAVSISQVPYHKRCD